MKKLSTTYLLISLGFLLFSCEKKEAPRVIQRGLIAEKAMVVSAREEASKIGLEIIQKGGNAFDAMMATEMALAVSYPFAGNLGGGGFMVYRLADGSTGSLDYREKAPLAASKDMYLDENGEFLNQLSTKGALASGVPGTVAGVFEAQAKFGKLSPAEILQPVIDLAKNGFVVTPNQATRLERVRQVVVEVNGEETFFNQEIKSGDTLKIPVLAATLERIAKNGRDEFYKGETAKILAKHMLAKGGIITEEDLANYQAVWRDPIVFPYRGFKIISMAPPSSGGITLAQILKMIEPFDLKSFGHHSPEYIQVLVEAERRAYADRNYFLGDPDFVNIPVDQLLDSEYLKSRMENFSIEKATKSEDIAEGKIQFSESMETTHYSIVDAEGNAISVTTTLNGGYGSKLFIDELGFFMNNEMDDFSAKPGTPNMFGLIGAEANSIAPGKRMLSSMTPTIVEKDGKLWMVVGTPGGSTIITSVLQTILNVAEFDMGMQEAVNAPRFHHQWLPDLVNFEPDSFDSTIISTLKSRGYLINEGNSPVIGKVDAILVLPDGKLEGGADRRGDDKAVGF
ncbi:gamma-glutamyltranspeptidase/glutathione hydrolase [Algoriphagus boseongensis]|uniref:Glutathione hydrolase proenzyme n=1 Tax=Algoriphagus boseongensis TaxID=1442587 RepID=A0A4R6TAW7_9BACT|nr:gamma-glutamyltransferase [Algoriphagus boseongensis]TDQ19122.1 gamma-glutamyltranspeptidase/glutathione hydrolase [Algoriphagus boseongensis]